MLQAMYGPKFNRLLLSIVSAGLGRHLAFGLTSRLSWGHVWLQWFNTCFSNFACFISVPLLFNVKGLYAF